MKINWMREGSRGLVAYFGRCRMKLGDDRRVCGTLPGKLTEEEEEAKEVALARFSVMTAENGCRDQESFAARVESFTNLAPVFPEGLRTVFYPEDGEGEKSFCVIYLGWKNYSISRAIRKMPGKPEEEVRAIVKEFFRKAIQELFEKVAEDEAEKLLRDNEDEYVKLLKR